MRRWRWRWFVKCDNIIVFGRGLVLRRINIFLFLGIRAIIDCQGVYCSKDKCEVM